MIATANPHTAANATGLFCRHRVKTSVPRPPNERIKRFAKAPPAVPLHNATSKLGTTKLKLMSRTSITPKCALFLQTQTAVSLASTMAEMINPLLRCSEARDTSSIANMTPAKGAFIKRCRNPGSTPPPRAIRARLRSKATQANGARHA